MRLTRFERGCVVVLVAAALVRLAFLVEPNFIWDSAWYLMLARSFGETGTFLIRWSEPGAPEYSGYWPPLFPVFAAPFVQLFGASYRTLVLASGVSAALLVAAVFFTTRDLFDRFEGASPGHPVPGQGRARAFAAAALVAASPAFYVSDAKGMSESLLGLMVVLTVWAFVRSLAAPRWLPVAGVFAFLAYLGKASLGLPFVAAAVAALAAWRVRTRGWRAVSRSPVDVGVAVVGLLGMAALAFTRSERVGGVGLGLIEPLRRGIVGADCGELAAQLAAQAQWFSHTGAHCWALAFPLKIAFVCAFLFAVTLPLSLRLPRLLRQPRTERTDALWLAVLLPIVAGAVFTTTFFFTEERTFVDFDNIRYLTPAIVPFIWLLLPLWTFADEPDAKDLRVRRHHETWYWMAVGAFVLILLLNPLTGTESLERFFGLTFLALVPIVLSLYARTTQYDIRERRVPGGVEHRYVRARQPLEGRRMVWIAAVVLIVGGWFYSTWYALLGYGLVIVLATPSTARRVVAMSLILLASAAPIAFTALPVEEMAEATRGFPEGTIVGMSEIIVYPAAAAPGHLDVRRVDPDEPIPPHIDALVMQAELGERQYEGFTRVASWEYRHHFFPTLRARLWIEETLLGQSFDYAQLTGLTLYVREGSGLEEHVRR